MKLRNVAAALSIACLPLVIAGCNREDTPSVANQPVAARKDAGPLPDNAFKALISLIEPPAKLRAGQKETLRVKVKNASDAQWYARGGELNRQPDNRYYVAVGNRWLKSDGKTLVTNMDGRFGIPKDVKPGEEVEISLQVTAPKEPGEYVLDLDLIQEQVAWFSDKGSPTARTKITVSR
jgi:hypothetical protein